YNESIRQQGRQRTIISHRVLRQTLAHLVLAENTFNKIGPAVNSGTSIFLYGPPGNGKTSIARSIGDSMLKETMFIPYAIYIDGQVVKIYDSVNHRLAPDEDATALG
ncbi:MAG: AAA family ATPase, partial [Deltaproteobacteria bacterium]|nr:AAA family ATPase [Deltaproteobacteria bacterium]